MSIERQNPSTDATPSAHVQRETPLTAANLATHDRNTPAMSTNDAIRMGLTGSENTHRRNFDTEAWKQLVRTDPAAAAIEAATQAGNQGRGQ